MNMRRILAVGAMALALVCAATTTSAQGTPGAALNRLAAYPAWLSPRQRHVWLDWLIADIEAKNAPRLTAAARLEPVSRETGRRPMGTRTRPQLSPAAC